MKSCSLAMSAIPTSTSSSSTSPCLSKLSVDILSLTTINFSIKTNPIKPPKLRTHFTNYSLPSSRSFVFSVSAAAASAFDGDDDGDEEDGEDTQNVQPQEAVYEEEEEEGGGGGGGDEEGVESLAAEERRLYVGNLPFSMTSSQLADLFAEAGRVISVEIIYDKVTDRSRGFAFVTMGSTEEAKEAIRKFEGTEAGGRAMKVNFPEVPKGGEREVMDPKIKSSNQGFIDSPHKIYAGNLSWGLTSQGLREVFADQPGFLSAKVIYQRDSGRSRGFGFVTFASAEEVESVLNAMNEVEVEGRPMRLNLAEQRAPTSSPPITERNSENELENGEVLSTAGI